MALIKCPECGKEISDGASSCPNCGHPIKGKGKGLPKSVKIVLAIVVALLAAPTLLFAGCVGTAFIFSPYGTVGGAELTVTLDDDSQEKIAANELKELWEENEISAADKYSGVEVSFSDKVREVHGPTIYNSYHMDGYVETDSYIVVEYDSSDSDLIKSLAGGDTIKVSGILQEVDDARRIIISASSIVKA